MRDDFTFAIKTKLAERSSFICSNPSCNVITIGPSTQDHTMSNKTGIAAHICAASPGGPRYDLSQSAIERSSISNGIWLCPNCATLIDKNNGIDYPATFLRKWKKDHEELMNICLLSNRRILFTNSNISNDQIIAKQIISFLEDRGALFMPYQIESPTFVIDSLKEIRIYLTQIRTSLESGSNLDQIIFSIISSCRHYMNTTPENCTRSEIIFGLGALRKAIGLNLKIIEKEYRIFINGPIKDILPK
jgi:hypothetical protein